MRNFIFKNGILLNFYLQIGLDMIEKVPSDYTPFLKYACMEGGILYFSHKDFSTVSLILGIFYV